MTYRYPCIVGPARRAIRPALLAGTLALSLGMAIPSAHAQGIPVIDTSQIAQVVASLRQQLKDYEEQLKQLATMKEQLDNMRARLEAITGPKGISQLLNGAADKLAREAAPDLASIADAAISGAGIGGNANGMKTLIDGLRSRFDLGDLATFDGSTVPADKAIASLAGSGMAAVATADDGYKRANAAMGRVTALIGRIDAAPDLKASVDTNTRVQAEIAVLLVELIRVQSAAAHTAGMQSLQTARDGAASRKFMKASDR